MGAVFISTSMPGRARPDYFFALGESFSKEGYNVIMIIDGKPEKLPHYDNLSLYSWPNLRPTGLADFIFLIRLIKKYEPSVLISSFGSVNIMNVCGIIMNVKNRINFILSVSEPFFDKPSLFDVVKRKFLKTRKVFIYQLASLIIYNSKGTEDDSKSYYSLGTKECLVLHNLIKNSEISYKSESERNRELIIVGNLIKRKGHSFLLKQFEVTLKTYPELNLLIVGDGIEMERLKLEAERLEILDNVNFIGKVPNHEIAEYFSRALISISSSTHEAFGFINIEAMREGTPIISTKTAGGLEIIEGDKYGCFFELDDNNSLLKGIKIILNNWEEYSKQAKFNFNNKYSLENQIEFHKNFIKSKLK